MVEDRIQNLDFVAYFYYNLFNPDENSKMQDKIKLNQRTIEILLNGLFVINDQETNEVTIRQYAADNNISIV